MTQSMGTKRGAMVFLMVMAVFIFGALSTVHADSSAIKISIDGKPLVVDAPSIVNNGTIYVSMPSLCKAWGINNWFINDNNIYIRMESLDIQMWVGETSALVNYQKKSIVGSPIRQGMTVYVPLRATCEMLGGSLSWNPNTREIMVKKSSPTVAVPGTNAQPPSTVTTNVIEGRSPAGKALSFGFFHLVGLRTDGTVAGTGGNEWGKMNFSDWTDVVEVAAGLNHTLGLKSDGTVLATGIADYGICDVSGWKDITAVAASGVTSIGLRKDGTVVATGRNDYGQCDVQGWQNVVDISAFGLNTAGLKSDGTVYVKGTNSCGQCDTASWKDIIQVSVGSDYVVGLKSDGTVVAIGDNEYGQCDVSAWRDIIAIDAGEWSTIGLKRDGSVVVTGKSIKTTKGGPLPNNIIAVSSGMDCAALSSDGKVYIIESPFSWNKVYDTSSWNNIGPRTK